AGAGETGDASATGDTGNTLSTEIPKTGRWEADLSILVSGILESSNSGSTKKSSAASNAASGSRRILPELSYEEVIRNMRAYDPQNPGEKECMSSSQKDEDGQPCKCMFFENCKKVNHPMLEDYTRSRIVGTSFRYPGEILGSTERRLCICCIIHRTYVKASSLAMIKKAEDGQGFRCNPFTVASSPQINGLLPEYLESDHPFIEPPFVRQDMNSAPCFVRRSEQYQVVYPLLTNFNLDASSIASSNSASSASNSAQKKEKEKEKEKKRKHQEEEEEDVNLLRGHSRQHQKQPQRRNNLPEDAIISLCPLYHSNLG